MERPILFSTHMVQIILEGKKTQTRRIIKGDIITGFDVKDRVPVVMKVEGNTAKGKSIKCPYGKPGDILWVRETWCRKLKNGNYAYKADRPNEPGYLQACYDDAVWRPSIYMPRGATRIFLRVTNVRVERLKDITEDDAKNEGIKSYWAEPHKNTPPFVGTGLCHNRREAFKELWDSLNSKRGYGWDANPWVWVIEFERVSEDGKTIRRS